MKGLLAVYGRPRLIFVLLMGFASGLPLALTGATLAVRLTEAHVMLGAIGAYALVQTAYNFKVLWAPFLDRVPLPLLTAWLGRRRSWLLFIQILLALAIWGLGRTDPTDAWTTALWAVGVAFLSASQDIVIDAYRVEILMADEQGAGAAATQFGYRLGMIASGAGALYAAAGFGWTGAYATMAALMLVGIATTLAAPEPVTAVVPGDGQGQDGQGRDGQGFDLATTIIRMVVDPFRDFTRRRGWLVLLIFVVLFKLGDAMAGHMALPFYVELGFSKIEIANVSKLIGVAAAMVGVALGGTIVYRLGVMRALILCGVLQMTSDLLYIVQNWAGHQVGVLAVTISVENIAGGMGSAAFVAYLSGLCSRAYTATQYALLSALALVGRNVFASISGLLAQGLGWPAFFAVATALALPGLAMLIWIGRRPEFGTPAVPEGAGTA